MTGAPPEVPPVAPAAHREQGSFAVQPRRALSAQIAHDGHSMLPRRAEGEVIRHGDVPVTQQRHEPDATYAPASTSQRDGVAHQEG